MSNYARAHAVSENLGKFFDTNKRKLALAINNELVLNTPFDERVAASNWYMTYMVPSKVFNKDKKSADSNPKIKGNDGPIIYITNNAPYIQRLNQGWSTQQKAGWVQATTKRAINSAKKGLNGN